MNNANPKEIAVDFKLIYNTKKDKFRIVVNNTENKRKTSKIPEGYITLKDYAKMNDIKYKTLLFRIEKMTLNNLIDFDEYFFLAPDGTIYIDIEA